MAKNCCSGPGYSSPLDALKNGPREKLLYVVAVQPNLDDPNGDYLATVDVDPKSPDYCKVIHRTYTKSKGNELHHSGWNACSSCHRVKPNEIPKRRDTLVLPSLTSDNIYFADVGTNERKPEFVRKIDGKVIREKFNCTALHTTHCLANGKIMISTLGDRDGNAKGDFILIDPADDYKVVGTWTKGDKIAKCGYDFWYQPYFNVMVATEWGAPKLFRTGWKDEHLNDMDQYGCRLNFYDWRQQKLVYTYRFPEDGYTPLEVRFLHDPKKFEGYVGCALFSTLYYFWFENGKINVEKVVESGSLNVPGMTNNKLNGLMGDIIISLDDRFLYYINWFHGDVRQYFIGDKCRRKPKLTGQVFLGGIPARPDVKVLDDKGCEIDWPKAVEVKGKKFEGGPQMMQLSLDGKRLYVSSSLFSPWDKQFYPDMVKNGGQIIMLDCNTDCDDGGMTLNKNFCVDFTKEPNGPALPHEMRYPGGDCTSEIWLAPDYDETAPPFKWY